MIKIELSDGNSSALLTIPDNATLQVRVMPMRI
jgi:DNA polymerase-3 subunit beta